MGSEQKLPRVCRSSHSAQCMTQTKRITEVIGVSLCKAMVDEIQILDVTDHIGLPEAIPTTIASHCFRRYVRLSTGTSVYLGMNFGSLGDTTVGSVWRKPPPEEPTAAPLHENGTNRSEPGTDVTQCHAGSPRPRSVFVCTWPALRRARARLP